MPFRFYVRVTPFLCFFQVRFIFRVFIFLLLPFIFIFIYRISLLYHVFYKSYLVGYDLWGGVVYR